MYKRIMIIVDDDDVSRLAAGEGLALAKALRAEVVFFHVLPVDAESTPDVPPLGRLSPAQRREESQRHAGRVLADAAELARNGGVQSSGAIGVSTNYADCIAAAARERSCDLIVVGSHGRDAIERIKYGSLAVSLIPVSPVPLLVCKKSGLSHQAQNGDGTWSPRG